MGTGKDHYSSNFVSLSVSNIPRILSIHLRFLATFSEWQAGEAWELSIKAILFQKTHFFFHFDGQPILILFQLLSSLI